MEPVNNIVKDNISYEIDELSSETPVGWSSICLDQTISYYIECNTMNSDTDTNIISITKELA